MHLHQRNVYRPLGLTVVASILALRASVASAGGPDFNNDGYVDLAIGVPFEAIGSSASVGAVHVAYGSGGGLATSGAQTWTQDSSGVPEASGAYDQFGYALTWGDFNGDGYDDLAIGAPGETLGVHTKAGCVHVLYGSAVGLVAAASQLWHQGSPLIEDKPERDDAFGRALAAGDFNNDGYADLAIGANGESIANKAAAGAVHVLLGSPIGLLGAGSRMFTQNTPGILGSSRKGDHFGFSLAVGDFDGDGFADLAIGVPQDDIPGVPNCGAVNVMYGSSIGLNVPRNQLWHQNVGAVGDVSESAEVFGWSLTAGDFNGDGRDDLAIGVLRERVNGVNAAGAVNVILGSTTGLTDQGNVFITQDALGGGQSANAQDLMSWALTVGDYNGDQLDDLAIGSPLDSVNSQIRAGLVHVIPGDLSGLNLTGAQIWSQAVGGMPDTPDSDDWFGASLASGDYNGDGSDDLAIGAPFEDDFTTRDTGALFIIKGSAGGLSGTGIAVFTQWDFGGHGAENDGMSWSLLK